jgi:DNA-directed RNA polymerase subunit H
MAAQVYPPNAIVRNLIDHFLPYRGLKLAPRSLTPDLAIRAYTEDEIIRDMEQLGYVRFDAVRDAPRGQRDWVVVFVLSAMGKYAHHGPKLRELFDNVMTDRLTKESRLDEVFIIAEEDFFGKKHVLDEVRDLQKAHHVGGPDAAGAAPFFNAYPYSTFSYVLPENKSVPRHEIMTPGEVAELLSRERLTIKDLPVIFAGVDPPVIWLGGREGQVVRITRASQTGGEALYYRRVEK